MQTPVQTSAQTPVEKIIDAGTITIAAHADHRREDFVFSRTQSRKLRAMAWESRLPPLRRTLLTCAANVAADVVARIA